MKIKVCDDQASNANDWINQIKGVVPKDWDVSEIENQIDAISQLLGRRLAVEQGDNPLAINAELDDIDIFVIDYDLLHFDKGERITGEGIARLARTYSKCGAIVVVNQFQGPQFDLGMRGHLDSYADMNIDGRLVGCSALWTETPANGKFNPTTWTPLPNILSASRQLAETISEKPEQPLMDTIGLEKEALELISDTAFGFLDSKAETIEDLTSLQADQFAKNFLDDSMVEHLLSCAKDLLFNFVAFRIVKWLDRAVLRPTNIIVDSHHLVDRMPFLIDLEGVNDLESESWTQAAKEPGKKLRWNIVEKFHNSMASAALGKQVFNWYLIDRDSDIDELHDEYLRSNSERRYYLAEDTSRFVEGEHLTLYRADFHNFEDRRTIEKLKDISYGPLRRIHFERND